MDNPDIAYLCYSRPGLETLKDARFERVYLDGNKAKQWINKKNCQSNRYYFWVSEPLRG